MTAQQRDSFETLDLDDVEEVVAEEERSGPRPVPSAPRGLWSDVPPPPLRTSSEVVPKLPPPAPTPRIQASPAHAESVEEEPVWERESERLSLDGLVADLSTRRPPAPTESWELPAPPVDVSARRSALAPGRATSRWWILGVGIATYALGVATPYLFGAGPAADPGATAAAADVATRAADEGRTVDAIDPVIVEATPEEENEAPLEAEAVFAGETGEPTAEANEPTPSRAALAEDAPSAPQRAARSASREGAARAAAPSAPAEAASADGPVLGAEPVAPASAGRVSPADGPVLGSEPIDRAPVTDVAPAEDLPATPLRSDIEAAMAGVRSDIQACGDPSTSGFVARVRFTFGSTGRVTHAVAQGVAGSTASCIARAARGAHVSSFARDRFVVEYPFTL